MTSWTAWPGLILSPSSLASGSWGGGGGGKTSRITGWEVWTGRKKTKQLLGSVEASRKGGQEVGWSGEIRRDKPCEEEVNGGEALRGGRAGSYLQEVGPEEGLYRGSQEPHDTRLLEQRPHHQPAKVLGQPLGGATLGEVRGGGGEDGE